MKGRFLANGGGGRVLDSPSSIPPLPSSASRGRPVVDGRRAEVLDLVRLIKRLDGGVVMRAEYVWEDVLLLLPVARECGLLDLCEEKEEKR